MPKQTANIKNFSGGLNNNTNTKDIKDNEFQVLLNLSNEVPGKLKPDGTADNVTVPAGVSGISTLNYGNGILYATLDRNISSPQTITESEYLFINDATNSVVLAHNLGTNAVTTAIDYGTDSSLVEMYNVDGEIRVIPHYGSANNKGKTYTYYKFTRKLGITTALSGDIGYTLSTFQTRDMHIAPIKGLDGYDYNLHTLFAHDVQFKPEYESEIVLYDLESSTFSTTDKSEIVLSSLTAHAYLNGHSEYTAAGGEGSMVIFAYFKDQDTEDTESSVRVYANKRYGIFVSKVYSSYNNALNKSESPAVYLGSVYQDTTITADKDQTLHLGLVGRMGERDPKYSGFKIYYALLDNWSTNNTLDFTTNIGGKYLLAEVDFEEGIRYSGEESYNPFEEISYVPGDLLTYYNYNYPIETDEHGWDVSAARLHGKEIYELSISEPYLNEEKSVIGRENTGFKTATIVNRKVYAGNVQYYDSKNNLVTKTDRILKSKPNQFDYFEEGAFIDVEIEDGDTIIKLESLGSQLLEFKKEKLFIINVSRDIEFLESTYDYRGCEKDYHVTKGEGFIAWLNKYGVFIFNGEQVVDITLDENGQQRLSNWTTSYYNDDAVIGYLPSTKEIYIGYKNTKILKFDLKSESWTQSNYFSTNTITNMVTKDDGTLAWLEINGGVTSRVEWDSTPHARTYNGVIMQTKEYDMDIPSVKKNFNTIYLNYKNGSNLTLQGFGTKMDNNPLPLTDIQALDAHSNGYETTRIRLDGTYKDLSSFGIALKQTGELSEDFELNDVQLIFRDKVVI